MPPAIISVRGLNKTYATGFQALKSIDLDIRPGEIFALLGPNGAGKTTFVDAVTGFVRAGGRVLLDGRELGGLQAHRRAQLGLARTWQSGELFDDLLVEENLAVAQERSPAWRIAFRTRTDEQAIRLPPRWSTIMRPNARMKYTVPLMLRLMTRSRSSSV